MGDPNAPPLQAKKLFALLEQHGVHYVVVGGLAAIVHGSARATFDIDLVPDWSTANLERLAAALRAADAQLRIPDASPVDYPIDVDSLRAFEVSTWRTRHDPRPSRSPHHEFGVPRLATPPADPLERNRLELRAARRARPPPLRAVIRLRRRRPAGRDRNSVRSDVAARVARSWRPSPPWSTTAWSVGTTDPMNHGFGCCRCSASTRPRGSATTGDGRPASPPRRSVCRSRRDGRSGTPRQGEEPETRRARGRSRQPSSRPAMGFRQQSNRFGDAHHRGDLAFLASARAPARSKAAHGRSAEDDRRATRLTGPRRRKPAEESPGGRERW